MKIIKVITIVAIIMIYTGILTSLGTIFLIKEIIIFDINNTNKTQILIPNAE